MDAQYYAARNVRESSPFPFKTGIFDSSSVKKKDNYQHQQQQQQKQNKPVSLINLRKENQIKGKIFLPNIKKNNQRNANIPNLNQNLKIKPPFATDTSNQTTPFKSPRRKNNIPKNQKDNIPIVPSPRKKVSDIINSSNNSKNNNIQLFFEVKQTDFGNMDLPLLPSSGKMFKVSQFPQRISKLESIVYNDHKNSIKNLTNLVNSISIDKNNGIERINLMIKEKIEKEMNQIENQINQSSNELFDKNFMNEMLIDNSDKSLSNEIRLFSDAIVDQKVAHYQISNSFQTFVSTNGVKSDILRQSDKIELTMKSLTELENRIAVKTAAVLRLKEDLAHLIGNLDESLQNFNKNSHILLENEKNRLFDMIQKETDETTHMFDTFSQDFLSSANKTVDTIIELKVKTEDIALSTNMTISDMESSIQNAIERISKESKKSISGLNEELDKAIDTSRQNFTAFRSETISTIDTIKNSNSFLFDEIIKKIEEEQQTIEKNSSDVQKKFDNFVALIENERNIQNRHFAEAVCIDLADEIVRKNLNVETNCLGSIFLLIDISEKRLNKIENDFNSKFEKSQIIVSETESNLKKSEDFLVIMKERNKNNFEQIEKRLSEMEAKPNKKDIAHKVELRALEELAFQKFDDRIQKLRQTVSKINKDLTKEKNKQCKKKKEITGVVQHFENPPLDSEKNEEYYSDEDVF